VSDQLRSSLDEPFTVRADRGGVAAARDINTGGGRITLREGDKSQERIVEALAKELKQKNTEIDKLRKENKLLLRQIAATEGAFSTVKMLIGGNVMSVNDYISHTCLFLLEKKLREDFWTSFQAEMFKTGMRND